jgi:hypothetical protein
MRNHTALIGLMLSVWVIAIGVYIQFGLGWSLMTLGALNVGIFVFSDFDGKANK